MTEYYTMNSTLEEILNNERVKKLNYLFSPSYYANIGKFLRKRKLKHMVKLVKTPWGGSFPAHGILTCANLLISRREAGEKTTIPIWQGVNEEAKTTTESVVLVPFIIKDKKNAPCVIICPGGGYEMVSFYNEGIPVAKALNKKGYNAFILNYCVSPNYYPIPQMDLVRGIKFVRANHEKLDINPDDLTIMGFSAGAHLCGSVAASYEKIPDDTHRYDHISARPDKVCLCYPVSSFINDAHEGSVLNHLGPESEEALRKELSVELMLTKDYPPTYLWACTDDPAVNVNNTINLEKAMENLKILHRMKLFLSGGHGIGLGEGTLAEGWLTDALEFLEK